MNLPDYITSMFDNFITGILTPIQGGFYKILVPISVIALVVCIAWLAVASRKGPAAISLAITIVLCMIINDIPGLIVAIFNYNGASGTVDVASAANTANQALQEGSQYIQGLQ